MVTAGLAFFVGTRSHQAGLLLAVVAVVGAFMFISAAVLRQNGFGIQARHVAPIVVAVTMSAGLSLRDWHPPRALAFVVAAVLAMVLVASWGYVNASYSATPTGLVLGAVSVRDALAGLRTLWSLPFIVGVCLACGSINAAGQRSVEAGP